jgi:hypothetical protein
MPWCGAAISDRGAKSLLVASPDFHLVKAGKDAQSDGTKDLLREAKKLVAAYNETPKPDQFITLLDWAFLAVHNGDPRLARQRRSAGDLGLDPRGRGLPGAREVDHQRARRRAAQAVGLRPRGAVEHEAA